MGKTRPLKYRKQCKRNNLSDILSAAIRLYFESKIDKQKFLKYHIKSILVGLFDVSIYNSMNKDSLIFELRNQVESRPVFNEI